MTDPVPTDEEERLDALRRYDILDTDPEEQFDDIARIASQICATPVALITMVDEKRQWFKARIGLAITETPREIAFCGHGILHTDVFVITDARTDKRFAANPLVTGPEGIRFYAGAPLITPDGHTLGMLCVTDRVPRDLTPEQRVALQALSRQIVTQMESRRVLKELREAVAELKQTKEELKWKTAFLEAQANASIDGILVVDPEGNNILQNQRTLDLLKIPPGIAENGDDEQQLRWVVGMAVDPSQFIEKVIYLNSNPDEISRDEIQFKDGTILDRYSSPVVGKDQTYYGRIWTFRDITEHKRLQTHLLQSQKMETVGKLAGGIAHEFNSIMTAIIGQSEILLENLPPDGALSKGATEIHTAAERAALLTRQLLAYGRKQFLQPEALDLNAVLSGMAGTLRQIVGRNIDVLVASVAGLKMVKADAGQIEQVIMNLAMNAADAMPSGGKLTLETANATLDEEYVRPFPDLKPGEYVMLAVTDTGSGMVPEIMARVFEPFFSTKGVGEGTGLGLSTCYGIIKQSDGHISAYSEPGLGASFKIYLPQVGQLPKPLHKPAVFPGLPRGTETILLVEDDEALRDLAKTLLQRLGYTVWSATNGIEALAMGQRRDIGPIDLLFTDVVMPHMSGKELSERLEAISPHTRTLFTSAFTENAIVHQGVMERGIVLLQKPFTPSALAHKLREALDQPATPQPPTGQPQSGDRLSNEVIQ